MSGEWKSVPIGTVAEIFDGPHATPKTVDAGPIFLGIDSLDNGRLNLAATRHVTEADFELWTRRVQPTTGDLVFSYETRIGQAAVIPNGLRCCLGRRLALARPHPRLLSSRYLLYYYLSPEFQEFLRSRTMPGSTVDRIHLRDFPSFPITLPPLAEQQRVADLLGSLDDKIELNRRMAETLEAMARALFKSWFVDFDPVRAKAEGRPTGLPDELAALFPDGFGRDGLPAGWLRRPLPTLARFLNGLALQKHPARDGEPSLPVIKIAELRVGPTPKSGRASQSVPADYHVKDGDHLFSWSGSLMHCRWTYGPGALNQHLFKVSSLGGIPDWLIYQAVEQHMPEFQAIASGKAVTMGHIQRYHLDQATVACPPPALLKAMDAIMSPLPSRSLAAALQSRTLAALRDTLLPKLISGELRIADAEARIAAA